MEENKEREPLFEGECDQKITEPEAVAQEPVCEDAVAEDTAQESAPTSDETPAEEAQQAQVCEEQLQEQEEPEPVQSFSWDFGKSEEQARKKEGKRTFFAVFGSVVAICLALLVLVLFMGEGGFQIIRTLQTERVVYVREYDSESGLLTPNEVADVIKKSTVTISVELESGSGTGSGFVYDNNGHICTNYHVIEKATRVQVILPDGMAHTAEVVGFNAAADLAVLRVNVEGLVPAKLGSSAELLVGDGVVAVGTPLGPELAATATFGKVSYNNRLLGVDDDGDGVYEKKIYVIQMDASVNPGNSGGPLADMYGRVVGLVVRKMANNEALGFAIPIDGAKTILDQIIAKGSFTGDNPLVEGRSLLGVTGHGGEAGKWYATDATTGLVQSSDTEVEGYYYMSVSGVYVMSADSANARGRFFAGDIVIAVNGLHVRDTTDLIEVVNRFPVGTTVNVTVWRGGTELTVQVILSEGEIA